MAKSAVELSDDFIRDARKKTLNKRINEKGNYENFVTGGSHSLGNQARIRDTNEHALALVSPEYYHDEWEDSLNPRYANPNHEDVKAYHQFTPSTRKGRREENLFFEPIRQKGQKHLDDARIDLRNRFNKWLENYEKGENTDYWNDEIQEIENLMRFKNQEEHNKWLDLGSTWMGEPEWINLTNKILSRDPDLYKNKY